MPPSRAIAARLLQQTERAYVLFAACVLALAPWAPEFALSLTFYPSIAFGMVAYVHGNFWFGAQYAPTRQQCKAVRRQLQARRKASSATK